MSPWMGTFQANVVALVVCRLSVCDTVSLAVSAACFSIAAA